ncbi:MAG TPA: alpha/beta hydrolase [Devosiaceae bacterium]|jgi:predicted alpha/beta hydrolase family esterase|nr:alpha/beta hydrolase [Devosiaceae bacterium]
MSRDVLFVQGGGEAVHDDWDSHLVESLRRELGPGYRVRYPRMPNEADPSYAIWRDAIEDEFASLGEGALLVAHSVGATILLNTLAERRPRRAFGGVFLVAPPFVGEGGWPSEEIADMAGIGSRLPEDLVIRLYHGADDGIVPIAHLDLYARAIPRAEVRRLPGRDHQLNGDLAEVAADIRRLAPS